jgi:hypothetical protein
MSTFSDGLPVPLSGLPPMEPRTESPPCRSAPPKGKAGKGQTGQRFRVLNDFVDFTLADLNRAEIAVWLILYRDTRDGSARTSMSDLARRAGCSRRNVVRAVQHLEKQRLLKVIYRGGFHKGSSRYCVRPLSKSG